LSSSLTSTPTLTLTATSTSTPSLTLHLAARAAQPREAVADKRGMLSFQRLEVYQRSIEFFAHALEIIDELPTKGHAEIADQLRRAAESQPLNIAEGAGRTSRPDIAKHYTIARGSAMECAAILDVMKLRGTLKLHRYDRGIDLLTSVVAMLTKMI
jgi:four helix bundle protein